DVQGLPALEPEVVAVPFRHRARGICGQHLLGQADLLLVGRDFPLLAQRPPSGQLAEVLAQFGQQVFESLAHGWLLSLTVYLLPGSPAPGFFEPVRGLPTSPGLSYRSIIAGSALGPYFICE